MKRQAALTLTIGLIVTLSGALQARDEGANDTLCDAISVDEYRSRRQELMRRVQAVSKPAARTVVVLRGGAESVLESRFKQTSDFWYLTGVDVPDAALVLLPAEGTATLYLPPLTPLAGTFEDLRHGPSEETARALGFDRVESTGAFLGELFAAIGDPLTGRGGNRRVAVHVTDPESGKDGATAEGWLVELLRQGAPGTSLEALRGHLDAMRRIKSQSEALLLRRAVSITAEGLNAAAARARPGVREYEVRGALEGAFTAAGAARPGFVSIIASGSNGCIPHYFGYLGTIEDGELVVMDVGAEYQRYTADVTRTIPANGRFTDRQRELYKLVLDAQRSAESQVEAGKTTLAGLTHRTREFFDRSPLRARDENGVERKMGHFFVHGLGHRIGLDVHDSGGAEEPLELGEMFTIEPGLYIRSEGIGIRIEDDYLLKAGGVERLTQSVPSAPEEVEKWVAEARTRAARQVATGDEPVAPEVVQEGVQEVPEPVR